MKKDNLIECLSIDKPVFEKVHIKAIKQSLGLSKGATNIACILEAGRYPVLIDILTQCVKYTFRADSLLGLASLVHIVANQNKQSIPFMICAKLFREAGLDLNNIEKDILTVHKINFISLKIKKSIISKFC